MSTKSDKEDRVQQILWEALKLSGETRSTYLETACAGDASLQEEVQSLLEAEGQAGTFLQAAIAKATLGPGSLPAGKRFGRRGYRRQPRGSTPPNQRAPAALRLGRTRLGLATRGVVSLAWTQHMDVARKPPCRLDLAFAAKAPVAMILRRGPSRRVTMIVWNTKTDEFKDGEWWHGRIYAEKCGLSPDGQLFVYFGYQWKPRYIPEDVFAFTAVSRPPSFKPVALWPADSFWGGGGRFLDNRTVSLNYGKGCLPEAHPSFRPYGLNVNENTGPRCQPPPDEDFRLDPVDYPGVDWIGKDHQGRLIFTRVGMLYRIVKNEEILLRDFNADVPPSLRGSINDLSPKKGRSFS